MKNRSEIDEHFHTGHQDGDMKVFLLQTGLSQSEEEQEYHEDRWTAFKVYNHQTLWTGTKKQVLRQANMPIQRLSEYKLSRSWKLLANSSHFHANFDHFSVFLFNTRFFL